MPFRTWLFIAAFGLSISPIWAQSQEHQNPAFERQPENESGQTDGNGGSSENAITEDQSATDLAPALQGIETAIHDLIPAVNEGASQQQAERDNADLDAQQSMAFWAAWMFVATVGTVITTLIGIILIWRTLHHTRRAADYARDMINEAKEATKATRAILMAERAFMVYDSFRAGGLAELPNENDRLGLVFEIWIKNVGRSPAKEFTVRTEKFVLGKDSIPPRLNAPRFSAERDPGGFCGPGQFIVTATHDFLWADIERHFAGNAKIFISGFGIYRDIFDQEQAMEFCMEINFRVSIDVLKNPGDRTLDESFAFLVVGPNNRNT